MVESTVLLPCAVCTAIQVAHKTTTSLPGRPLAPMILLSTFVNIITGFDEIEGYI